MFTYLLENIQKSFIDSIFIKFHTKVCDLRYGYIAVSVTGKTGNLVCLTVNDPAAFEIITLHYSLSVLNGIKDPSIPEFEIKNVIAVPGDDPDSDLRIGIIESRALPAGTFKAVNNTSVRQI
jgi:hypothetical protein